MLYKIADPVANAGYSIKAQFNDGSEVIKNGILRIDVPDVGIKEINLTRETNKQRDFSVQLTNNSYSKLTAGKHTVKLLVYDTTDFEARMPIASQTISDAESIELLNDSMLPLNITLNAEALKGILGEDGEILEGEAWIFFRAVLMENSVVIDDADIGNDMDYVKVYSLIERNGTIYCS